jgi:hypothetical protein
VPGHLPDQRGSSGAAQNTSTNPRTNLREVAGAVGGVVLAGGAGGVGETRDVVQLVAAAELQREGRLAPRQLAHRAMDQLVVAGRRDLGLSPRRGRVRAGGRGGHPSGSRPPRSCAQVGGSSSITSSSIPRV